MVVTVELQDEIKGAWLAVKHRQAAVGHARAAALLNRGCHCAEVYEILGMCLALQQMNDEARKAFRTATANEPSRISAHLNFAKFLASVGELDDASEECGTVFVLQPGHPEALKLHEWVSTRMRDLRYTAEQGFAAVGSGPDITHNPDSKWNNVECTACGNRNHFSSRTCKRCGNMLPEMPEMRCRE